ncbi:MAG: orc1/cdc6 family replication initiation protein [archaeon]
MVQPNLNTFFKSYLDEKSLFSNKSALQLSYTPDVVLHREKEVNLIADILAPLLKREKPSNLFVYGITGTGKTLTVKYVCLHLLGVAQENKTPLKIVYLNCKLKRTADTAYRLMAQLIREFNVDVPATGLPTDEVYNIFLNILSKNPTQLLIVLDEIDQLINKAGDEVIYNLTRINSELVGSVISIVGISNSTVFLDNLDPRVKSSLSEEELTFPPYNAVQIQDILKQRAAIAFKPGALQSGVIEKCSAYAAREHGDARRAIELLRVAGELAERKKREQVEIKDLDEAEDKMEKERVLDIIKTLPKQSQATLYCIITVFSGDSKTKISTGDIYEQYKLLCQTLSLRPLTQRRISDILAELDMLGIVNANVISKGRYGRTKEISIDLPSSLVDKIRVLLKEEIESE